MEDVDAIAKIHLGGRRDIPVPGHGEGLFSAAGAFARSLVVIRKQDDFDTTNGLSIAIDHENRPPFVEAFVGRESLT